MDDLTAERIVGSLGNSRVLRLPATWERERLAPGKRALLVLRRDRSILILPKPEGA